MTRLAKLIDNIAYRLPTRALRIAQAARKRTLSTSPKGQERPNPPSPFA